MFLAHKVISLDRKITKNEKNFFKNIDAYRKKMSKMSIEKVNELMSKERSLSNKDLKKSFELNNKVQNKSSINKPFSSSTSSYLFDSNFSSKQPIIKRHMLNSPDLKSVESEKNLNLENLDKIVETVKKLNEHNPLALLRFRPKDITKINRIYLLSYFRSGSSFLGDLLQQHYRTFYQFEPLHFRSIASRLLNNDTKTDASIKLVLNMLNECDFHSKGTANYLNWISKYDNKFLLSWNHFLYGLCKFNQSKCSDEKFVEQVCNLAEQRITKLTRVNLNDLIRIMNSDNSFENYIKTNSNSSVMMNDKLIFEIGTSSTISHSSSADSITNSISSNLNSFNHLNSSNNLNSTNNSNGSNKLNNSDNSTKILEVEPIKIIYLVRDPRAIYSSRQYLSWCKNRACTNIDKLCDEMNQDFRIFESFYLNSSRSQTSHVITLKNQSNKYPIQLFLVRFELIALEPIKSTSELFKLVNLPFKQNIKRFVVSHTASNLDIKDIKSPFKKWYLNKVSNDPHSTKRNSTKIPFDWIHKLNWSKIDEIQSKCKYSMDKLGYKQISNEQFKNIPNDLTNLLLIRTNNYTLF